ncbi:MULTISPECIES: class I SAM-dependent DNA methyltransferase [unclassified Streptomyces]|uniref:class I SAM-dependent DNA methyltransferase n=1 Tax=unclassified Streptomyces TaxID=2593676 RepID=UPI002E7663F0|nr:MULTISPECIES: methyltransferase domain-containing protein [unclassified Streptomyces]MEE1762775.1 methyltransferase domain-containing protein [Streptomyces sp. SP18BB07]MEE1830846.1 methyltransferase domain-containing protein [Streptomyces sp. SP17KL33]
MSNSFANIKQSHVFFDDAPGLKDYYEGWASRYDVDLADQKWVAPRIAANLVHLLASSYVTPDPTVLDAGCGTGLVGSVLRTLGDYVIDGVDLSENMAAEAFKTQAYRKVLGGVDLAAPPRDDHPDRYGIVVSSGVFTLGHVRPPALLTLIEYALPGGLIAVSTRGSYATETGFEDFARSGAVAALASLEFKLSNARYIAEEGADYWVFRRTGPAGSTRDRRR